jgi:hypothetical protein
MEELCGETENSSLTLTTIEVNTRLHTNLKLNEKEIVNSMKRAITGFTSAALVIALTTSIPTALASTSSQWFKMSLQVNGSTLSSPYGIAESDGSTTTTYIPMYYVDQALIKVGYQVSWDGSTKTWALTTTKTGLDFSSIATGSGNTSITVNGTLIKQLNSIVQADPQDGVSTTYIPIYYVSPLIKALGINATWNGVSHTWSIDNSGSTSSDGSGSISITTEPPSSGSTSGGGTASSPSGSSTSGSPSTGTLSAPTISVEQSQTSSNISVTGASSGATLVLYDSSGNEVVSTGADNNGAATFFNVQPGSYDVVASANGQTSTPSNTVTIAATQTVSTPSIFASQSNGVWYIGVNNAGSNATVSLYSTSGNLIGTTSANQYGYATFNDIVGGSYYVVETSNGHTIQSNAISVNENGSGNSLTAPSLALNANGSTNTLSVTGAQANATITLYTASGSVFGTQTADASGDTNFTNVPSGSYYVTQTVNGTLSPQSSQVSVNATSSNLAAPVLVLSTSNGASTLSVYNAQANATIILYTSAGTAAASATANYAGYASFTGIPNGTYYAVQVLNGSQSPQSNQVTSTNSVSTTTLSAPTLSVSVSNGTSTISAYNLRSSATVTLYTNTGAVVGTATANTYDYATFTNIPGGTYYAVQELNGVQSPLSNQVTVTTGTALASPVLSVNSSNNIDSLSVTNVQAGATVTIYTATGIAYGATYASSAGTVSFANVPNGAYYAVQTVNNAESGQSNQVTIANSASTSLNTPTVAVNISNGISTVSVYNLQANAIVTLYNSSGSTYATATANSYGYATFTNVQNGTYHAIERYSNAQSSVSNEVVVGSGSNAVLSTPSLTFSVNNGTAYVAVGNLQAGATVTLYTSAGSVYNSATADSSGNATFAGVPSGTYYAIQSANNQQSAASNRITI